jgi:hypothetical protein
MEDTKRRSLWHGMFLFLTGLPTGLVEQRFNNPRMGLAAHLEGVMNGVFRVALGSSTSTRKRTENSWAIDSTHRSPQVHAGGDTRLLSSCRESAHVWKSRRRTLAAS